jgi:hypothetical protein
MHPLLNRPLLIAALALALGLSSAAAAGRNLYVDPKLGDDRANGLAAKPEGSDGPFKTIARGLRLAQPGDTVHLLPAVYHETAAFHNRHGEPGRPITLDGHGATLEGSDPLVPADWTQLSPGVYRNDKLLPARLLTADDAVIRRWFFLFDGRINHMNRTMKGPSEPLKKPADLKPDEWTFVKDEHAFYVCIDPNSTLADAKIAAPLRGAGVAMSGDCSHIVVRNVTAAHVYNDGYNIHGKTRDVLFENIAAVECGDDGVSAHDDCTIRVDGFRSIGNSTGIANTGRSRSHNARVWIQDCLGVDLLFLDEGFDSESAPESNSHVIVDSVILSSAFTCLSLDGSKGLAKPCRLRLENVLVRREKPAGAMRIAKNSILELDHVTLLGAVQIVARGGLLKFMNTVIGGSPVPEITLSAGVTWEADHNWYDLPAVQWNEVSYTGRDFSKFRQATGQDAHSRWEPLTIVEGNPTGLPSGVGIDPSRLPRPKD